MKQLITAEEVKNLYEKNSEWEDIALFLNQRFTKGFTTPKQPDPLPEFEPFDIERAREGEDVWHENGDKAQQYFVFYDNYNSVVVLWENESNIVTYPAFSHHLLRHKRKPKPIEFHKSLDETERVFNKPSDFDKVELLSSIHGEDVMKATKGNSVAYYLGKFNDGILYERHYKLKP